MKKIALAVAVLALAGMSYATQVLPTSNVLGDTAATASTLVYRDANGVFDAASLEDGTVVTAKLASDSVITSKILNAAVVTAKLASESVTTAKLYLDLESSKVACITTQKKLGYCTSLTATTGVCNTCN